MELVGWLITVIAVTGVILNNQRRRGCFWLWLVSNSLSAGVHFAAGLYALACRDVIFFALAIHGLVAWSRKRQGRE
jgi:nicotinamide riboside transporter PnuC